MNTFGRMVHTFNVQQVKILFYNFGRNFHFYRKCSFLDKFRIHPELLLSSNLVCIVGFPCISDLFLIHKNYLKIKIISYRSNRFYKHHMFLYHYIICNSLYNTHIFCSHHYKTCPFRNP